jgi:hypothetical protein
LRWDSWGSSGRSSCRPMNVASSRATARPARARVQPALGFLQQPRTLRKIRLLANDGNPRVRAWVAIALGNFSALDVLSGEVVDG